MPNTNSPSRWSVIAAFAAVYLIWGSTYLAILWAIKSLPPFLMAGTRFLIAGALLYVWVRLRGTPKPAPYHWGSTGVIGGLLLLGGNGGVVQAEQLVPSSLTALLIATVPLWMVLLEWVRGGTRPRAGVAIGLTAGLAGIALLVSPGEIVGGSHVNPVGAVVLVLASLSWAIGSLYSRRARLPDSPLLATGMEMLTGGALLLIAGSITGEWTKLDLVQVSLRSAISFLYLIVFGSLIGFTAYIWLLRVSTPARVSTYAYVNPVIAVLLGAALAGEPITPRTLLAAAIILGAVVLITTYGTTKTTKHTKDATASLERIKAEGSTVAVAPRR